MWHWCTVIYTKTTPVLFFGASCQPKCSKYKLKKFSLAHNSWWNILGSCSTTFPSDLLWETRNVKRSWLKRETAAVQLLVDSRWSIPWVAFQLHHKRLVSDRDTAACSSSILGQRLVFHIITLLQIGAILSCLLSRTSAEARWVKLFSQSLPITHIKLHFPSTMEG